MRIIIAKVQTYLQWNLINMNSRGPSEKVHFKRNFTLSVAICMGVIMLRDLKVVHIKQVVRFNLVRIYCRTQ